MGRTRPPYAAEFKQQIVELYRAGRTPGQLASEFEPSEVTIRHWITQAEADEGRRPGVLTSTERDELRRLRRELKRVQTERDILARATAGSLERPTRMPGGLRVRERSPGRLSCDHLVPGAGRLSQRLLRLAPSTAVEARDG